MRSLLICALVASVLTCTGVASAGESSASSYPASVAVLGNSAAAAYGTDTGHPYQAVPANSWATGANPAVNSVYLRILALNPAIRNHSFNFSSEEGGIDKLASQVQKALTAKPDLVLVEVDGDVECDGKDQSRITDYSSKMGSALDSLTKGLPNARVFVVSYWGSFASYVKYLEALPSAARLKHAGKGPCQMVASPSGQVVPAHVAYIQGVVAGYEKQLAAVCARYKQCRYDGGAAQRMAVTAADISLDQNHLSIAGQAKLAAIEWAAMASFIKG
jgi:hypothetical protein